MLTWLALIAVGVVVFQLERRIRVLEQRLGRGAEMQDAVGTDMAPAAPPIPAWEAEPEATSVASELVAAATAEPEREPEPEQKPTEWIDRPREPRWRAIGFEDLFGRRLPIWAGGITLAIAGMLIVKLSIEAGLLSPLVRVIAGALFGLALLGGAEAALRNEERVRDARVRQALAGAGIASLYASVLIAANVYQLLAPLPAMIGMAAVTALALAASVRFGAPSALLGLAGGLAAPALIGSDEPNIPLLSLYLALAVGGLCALSRSQRWVWLGISALVGGFGWGLVLIAEGALDLPGTISVGLYLLLLGMALPALSFAGERSAKIQLIAAIAAAAQMAALVATGGFTLLHWGLFGLISLAIHWLAARERSLAQLPPVGLMIALLLMSVWPAPAVGEFALVLSGTAMVYGAPALSLFWRARGLLDSAQLAAIALAGLLLPLLHFRRPDGSADLDLGLLGLALSAAAAGCAALGWKSAAGRHDPFAILSTASALLLAGAATLLLPGWLVGIGIAAVGLALLHVARIADDARLESGAWVFAAAGLLEFLGASIVTSSSPEIEALRWGLLALVSAGFAWRGRLPRGQTAAQSLAPLFVYGALAAIIAERFEPLIAPPLLLALTALQLRVRESLVPALGAMLLVILLWALAPMEQWGDAAIASVAGQPMFVTAVPAINSALTRLLVPGAAIACSAWLLWTRLTARQRRIGMVTAGALVLVSLHSLFKQLFQIGSPEAFVALGLAERTVWELIMLGAAAVLWRLERPVLSLAPLAVAAGHVTLYTLMLHNPLWSPQAVGPLPVFNWLLPAYAVPFALILAAQRHDLLRDRVDEHWLAVVRMVLILLLAVSMLRQLFHGSLLVEPGVSQGEDIARSIGAVLIAIGFLLWGIAKQRREWRLGSLVLMIGAVAKVFLLDAAGLGGLVRVASFVALGFSLIGIGWLYSRYLATDSRARAKAA